MTSAVPPAAPGTESAAAAADPVARLRSDGLFVWARWRPWVLGAAALGLAVLLAVALRSLLAEVQYANVLAAVSATSGGAIAASLLATALSYLALSGYDSSGLRYAGARVDRMTVLVTSFTAYALGNSVGFGVLTGGAVRLRMYGAAGVEPAKVAQAIAFNASAFGLGMTAFGALGLLWGASEVAGIAHLAPWLLQGLALALLAGVAALLWLCAQRREMLLWRWRLRLPPVGLAWRQLVISAADLCAAGAALWFLLPEGAVGPASFVAFYAIALALSVISHVPGGLGVFEAVILLACGGRVPTEAVLGALLLYRGIYFLLPLVLATALLAFYELRSGIAAPVGRAVVHVSPVLLAALAAIAGVWLLFSGVTPTSEEAQQMLALHVPLPLVEASHFIGSVIGLGMLLVARGLLHRLDVAWWAALVLSCVSSVLALPKGVALSEAALFASLAVLLVVSRRQFDRRSSLVDQRLEPEWLLAVGAVLAAAIWVLFFAYQDVPYARQLWWQFEFDAQAPRSLRAITAVALVVAGLALWQLLSPPPPDDLPLPGPAELDQASQALAADPNAAACLVLTGDKHLLFSPSGRSFIMYGQNRRSWIALFDPVGDPKEFPELVWRFIERAAAHGGRAAFYQVRPQLLPLYLDAGLRAFKLGEHAHVPLTDFSLKGGARANLRSGVNRGEREGLVFELLPPGAAEPLMAELRDVSDAWLATQNVREKGFSLGAFDEDYVRRLPVAVVRQGERVLAFATLMATGLKVEASVDLMRHRPGMPNGTMDFLFGKLLLRLREEGYQRFGLGMAPMSGMAEHPLASRWQRYGRLLYEHGERFYNFQGLRSFKEKFDPVWEARYLVAPGGASPLLALSDTAALISGGLRGAVAK